MRRGLQSDRPTFADPIGFYHGIPGNATGIQLLLSFGFATFFKLQIEKINSYKLLGTLWLH